MELKFKENGLLQQRLEQLAKKVKGGGTLRVGFLEGATYPDGKPVATVAALQNFGAPAAGIPPRPFFSNLIAQRSAAWGANLGRALEKSDWDGPTALALLGESVVGEIKQSIIDTTEPPNADSTVARKGFDDPLIDTAHMLNSVDYEVQS